MKIDWDGKPRYCEGRKLMLSSNYRSQKRLMKSVKQVIKNGVVRLPDLTLHTLFSSELKTRDIDYLFKHLFTYGPIAFRDAEIYMQAAITHPNLSPKLTKWSDLFHTGKGYLFTSPNKRKRGFVLPQEESLGLLREVLHSGLKIEPLLDEFLLNLNKGESAPLVVDHFFRFTRNIDELIALSDPVELFKLINSNPSFLVSLLSNKDISSDSLEWILESGELTFTANETMVEWLLFNLDEYVTLKSYDEDAWFSKSTVLSNIVDLMGHLTSDVIPSELPWDWKLKMMESLYPAGSFYAGLLSCVRRNQLSEQQVD